MNPLKSDLREAVAKLWAEGLPLAAIAGELGITRSAAAGFVSRMKLPKRGGAGASRKQPREKPQKPSRVASTFRPGMLPPRPQSAPASAPAPPFAPPPKKHQEAAPPTACTFMDLTLDTCRWPYGDRDFRFCGRKVSNRPWGQSLCPYCDEHAERAVGRRMRAEAA